jgi:hypothetical protein
MFSMTKKILKSVGSVLAGVLVIVVLSVVTDLILEKVGFFPPPDQGLFDNKLLAIALFYRTVYALVGGYVTGKLAPFKPAKHVMALLIIGTIMGLLGVVVGWNLSDRWYPISLVATSAVAVWYGGKCAAK